MTVDKYSAADIQIVEFDEHVRTHPQMYFQADRNNPDFATRVLGNVLGHALHPAARLAAAHTLQIEAEITGDLAFVVRDDRADALDEQGNPQLGYFGSLLRPERWGSAAAGAVSSRVVIEVWRNGHAFRQELAGLRPLSEPRKIGPGAGTGTRIAFELDRVYMERSHALTLDFTELDLHGPDCNEPAGPGRVTLTDLRDPDRPVIAHHP
ncbi:MULTISPECIES: hypothetical protein [unclassified Streptomyces]|uniref:hypothetical protein n=1 Tax=unclassified Streptomyces TaxID=2593676 RepID=UPI00143EBA0B|nr:MULTISPECIES: hypothetical protein [unclassified Streptomyces]QIY66405.1 hypothetical protein HEP85_38855 [Streptomyces sp. RPA4-2]